jgi:D-aminopeptidase
VDAPASLRAHGLRIGELPAGPTGSIADVAGVGVGHVTVVRDEPEPPAGRGIARTGVTAVLPGDPASLWAEPVPAGVAVLNGAGEMTGSLQIAEWGVLETPVYLTSTMAVGRVFDGAVAAAVAADPRVGVEGVIIPVVAECDDSWLSDARVVQVEADDAGRALAAATAGGVQQGKLHRPRRHGCAVDLGPAHTSGPSSGPWPRPHRIGGAARERGDLPRPVDDRPRSVRRARGVEIPGR